MSESTSLMALSPCSRKRARATERKRRQREREKTAKLNPGHDDDDEPTTSGFSVCSSSSVEAEQTKRRREDATERKRRSRARMPSEERKENERLEKKRQRASASSVELRRIGDERRMARQLEAVDELLAAWQLKREAAIEDAITKNVNIDRLRTAAYEYQNSKFASRRTTGRQEGMLEAANLLAAAAQVDALMLEVSEEMLAKSTQANALRLFRRLNDEAKEQNLETSTFGLVDKAKQLTVKLDFIVAQATERYEEVRAKLHHQLHARVFHPKGTTSAEAALRVLGRVQYHVKARSDKNVQGWLPMTELYPALHREFMGQASEVMVVDDKQEDVANEAEAEEVAVQPEKEVDDETQLELADQDDDDEFVQVLELRTNDENAQDAAVADEAVRAEFDNVTAEDAGPIGFVVLRAMTLIRRCDCPTTSPAEAAHVLQRLWQLVAVKDVNQNTVAQFDKLANENISTLGDNTVDGWLAKRSPCFAGIRSVVKRLRELERCAKYVDDVKQALATGNLSYIQMTADAAEAPLWLLNKMTAEFGATQSSLTEANAKQQHGKLITKFETAIQELEVEACDVCNQLNRPSKMSKLPARRFANLLAEDLKAKEEVDVCLYCRRELLAKKIPTNAINNGFKLDDVPDELNNLNWLERALIQQVRPVQTIVHLFDKGGRKTGIPATSGAMVLLPVPVENTFDHVAATLPSASNLKLVVDTGFEQRIVSLPKVLKALRWLKQENPYYAGININEHFKFVAEDVVAFQCPDAAKRLDMLTADDGEQDIGHLLTQNQIDIQPTRSIDPPMAAGTAADQYRLQKGKYAPMKVDPKGGYEERSFPHLLPKGRFGASDSDRSRQTTLSRYTRARLMNKDRRFATDVHWMAFSYGMRTQVDMMSSLGVRARMGRNVSGAELASLLKADDPKATALLTSALGNMRGFAPYWESVKQNLKASIALFGAPTFFVTLNPYEGWSEVIETYSRLTGDVVDESNIKAKIAADPVPWTRLFQHRVKHAFDLLRSPQGPLGHVTHWFTRLEYQARGTEHLHCLLWTRERPTDEWTDEQTVTFLDKYVTARMPDAKEEPTLHALIQQHQMHWKTHSTTCQRIVKHRGKVFKTCRFEFPRPVQAKTTVNKLPPGLLAAPGAKRKRYYLKRRAGEDQMVNDFNPALTLAWKANTDVQVLYTTFDVVAYVTGYATKAESAKKGTSTLNESIRKGRVPAQELMKTCIELLRTRESGSMEMADMLLGHHLYAFDVGHVFINTNETDKRDRMLVPSEKLESANKVFMSNMVDTYYPQRPAQLAGYSLLNIACNFDAVTQTRARQVVKSRNDDGNDDDDDDDAGMASMPTSDNPFAGLFATNDRCSPFFTHGHINVGTGLAIDGAAGKVFRKRKPNVPRLYWPKLEAANEAAREDWFRRLLMLLKPWRNEEELIGEHAKYELAYNSFLEEVRERSANAFKDIKKFVERHEQQLELDAQVFDQRQQLKEALGANEVETDANDDIELAPREVDAEKFADDYARLNDVQKRIVDDVLTKVEARCADPAQAEPARMFVSGTAGTGKSFVIGVLADKLTLDHGSDKNSGFRPPVVILAPTGLAAAQIRGSTFHSMFAIEVQHGRSSGLRPLKSQQLSQLRQFLVNLKLIIIDELSMVSNVLLAKLHSRLTEIRSNQEPFGGVNIVAFGDLLQLPPVMAGRVFEMMRDYEVRRLFGGLAPAFTLWPAFEYGELTQNMRQKDDLIYAELMGRMRVQALNDDDIALLKTRLIAPDGASSEQLVARYIGLMEVDPFVMALFATNDEVAEFNALVMTTTNMTTITVEAEDTYNKKANDPAREARRRPYQEGQYSIEVRQKKRTDGHNDNDDNDDDASSATNKPRKSAKTGASRAGGLEQKLQLAIGARVMLRRNINAARGLVNGKTGVLVGLNTTGNGKPYQLRIQFDGVDEVQLVGKETAIFDVGLDEQVTRRQFPVAVAFACTIHKCQGLTLRNAIVSPAHAFAAGQMFVAFSRVQNLAGLHLANFRADKIRVDTMSLHEYNRLRQTVDLPVFALPEKPTKKATPAGDKAPKRLSDRISADVLMHTSPRPSPTTSTKTPPTARKAAVAPPPSSQGQQSQCLKLLNTTSTECFLNAAVNAIWRMVDVRLGLLAMVNNLTPTQTALQQVLGGSINDTKPLRRTLSAALAVGQRDARDALSELLASMPPDVCPLVAFTTRTETFCGCAERRRVRTHEDMMASTIVMRPGDMQAKLDELSGTRELNVCEHCDLPRRQRRSFEFADDSKYFVLGIDRDLVAMPSINKAGERLVFGGGEWQLAAAVEYLPGNARDGTNGHYVSWLRTPGGMWTHADDTRATSRQRLPNGLSGLNCLILERL